MSNEVGKVGDNAIFHGDERYGPGSEVKRSDFTKEAWENFIGNGSIKVSKAKPEKAAAPKESGGKAEPKAAATEPDKGE